MRSQLVGCRLFPKLRDHLSRLAVFTRRSPQTSARVQCSTAWKSTHPPSSRTLSAQRHRTHRASVHSRQAVSHGKHSRSFRKKPAAQRAQSSEETATAQPAVSFLCLHCPLSDRNRSSPYDRHAAGALHVLHVASHRRQVVSLRKYPVSQWMNPPATIVTRQPSNATSFATHAPAETRRGCRTRAVLRLIVLVVLAGGVLIAGVCAAADFAVHRVIVGQKRRKQQEQRVFRIAHSNVPMLRSKYGLLVSAESVFFEERLSTQQKSREFFCVGNADQHHVKVQFVLKQDNDMFAMSTDPQVVVPKPGNACEFQVFVRSVLSCFINESAVVVSLDMRTGTTKQMTVKVQDDALAAIRWLLDAELTFPTIRAFDQQTERIRAKAAGAAPGAFCLCAGMLRRKLSWNLLPLQVPAAECAQTDLALYNDFFPRSTRWRRLTGTWTSRKSQRTAPRRGRPEHSAVHPERGASLPSPAQRIPIDWLINSPFCLFFL